MWSLRSKTYKSGQAVESTAIARAKERPASIAAPAAAHDAVFLAIHGLGGRSLLFSLVGSVGRLRGGLSLTLSLGLLLLPQLALAVGLVLLDVGLGELDDGCWTAEHFGCIFEVCLQEKEEV